MKNSTDLEEKRKNLVALPSVAQKLARPYYQKLLMGKNLDQQVTILSLIALEQEEALGQLHDLVAVERFYASLGGLVGYHLLACALIARISHQYSSRFGQTVLPDDKERPEGRVKLTLSRGYLKSDGETDGQSGRTVGEKCGLEGHKKEEIKSCYHRPPGYEIAQKDSFTWLGVIEGIRMAPKMGELYPVAGLGVRLNLRTEEGKPLPAAYLPFCGRSLLEGLVRDVQAREYLHYKLFGKEVTIPIALMTCKKNDNHRLIEELLQKHDWFGRPQESFFLFPQLLVPVVTKEGIWSRLSPEKLNLQPGGHGAIWKTAQEYGIFEWFSSQKRDYLLVRQINNPIAGVDHGLLALMGVGKGEKKTFGLASCERAVHTAEGVLVCVEAEDKTRRITNIEYTEFARHNIQDTPAKNGYSQYPTNTNILFVDLQKLLPIIEKHPIPALHINIKSKVPYFDEKGEKKELPGGRLESMMQNISDFLIEKADTPLPTFVTYNDRVKTISVTKRAPENKQELLESPERAFEDLLKNGYDLLKNYCQFQVDAPILFLYHPALGPLYEIISQKLRGGRITSNSELQLEIAELDMENLTLDGSLLIEAKNVIGQAEKSGKCVLKNVSVKNQGVDKEADNCFWKNQIFRKGALTIHLTGNGEFYAEDTTFTGSQTFVVSDGERWEIREGQMEKTLLDHPSWQWTCHLEEAKIYLKSSSYQANELCLHQ